VGRAFRVFGILPERIAGSAIGVNAFTAVAFLYHVASFASAAKFGNLSASISRFLFKSPLSGNSSKTKIATGVSLDLVNPSPWISLGGERSVETPSLIAKLATEKIGKTDRNASH
jgi:hypothetical protein